MIAAKKYLICIGIGVLVEIVAAILLVLLAFSTIPVSLDRIVVFVFPYSCYSNLQIAFPLVFASAFSLLLQWPLYGWILGSGWVHHRISRYAVVLAGFHIIAAVVAFWYISKHPADISHAWRM